MNLDVALPSSPGEFSGQADDREEIRQQDEMMRAEIGNLIAGTSKINAENRWYRAVAASGATLAIVAIVELFL